MGPSIFNSSLSLYITLLTTQCYYMGLKYILERVIVGCEEVVDPILSLLPFCFASFPFPSIYWAKETVTNWRWRFLVHQFASVLALPLFSFPHSKFCLLFFFFSIIIIIIFLCLPIFGNFKLVTFKNWNSRDYVPVSMDI